MIYKHLIFYGIFILMLAACRKTDNIGVTSISAINVINVAPGIPNIKVNQTGKPVNFFEIPDQVAYGTARIYYAPAGVTSFMVIRSKDSSLLFNNMYDLTSGMHSMYIFGDSTHVDTLFRKENLRTIYTDVSIPSTKDSIIYVRFVNLLQQGPSIKVTLSTSPSIAEVDNLGYKGISSFSEYPANGSSPARYVFQIWDAADNTLLATSTLSISTTNRFKNMALVVRGRVGATPPFNPAVSIINYF